MTNPPPILTADFEKRFTPDVAIRAAFSLPRTITAIFGPSGCGKTTILRCLAGLEKPQTGFITFQNQPWLDAAARHFIPPQRRNVGFLFQHYALFPHLTVASNIRFGIKSLPRHEQNHRVAVLLDLLQLHNLDRRYPHQLSGGQQQRIALARALACRPQLLLLDEPLSALDAATREVLRRELRLLLTQLDIPCFLVTHDRLEAMTLADHAIIMEQGEILQAGPIDHVFSKPASLHVARMLGVESLLPAAIVEVRDGLATIRVNAITLTAIASASPIALPCPVHICIRGEDITLLAPGSLQTSARNALPAIVTELQNDGPLVRVSLDAGFSLVALITKAAAGDLALQPNSAVIALIKAPNIHVIPRG